MHSRKILITLIGFLVFGALAARAQSPKLPDDVKTIIQESKEKISKAKNFSAGIKGAQSFGATNSTRNTLAETVSKLKAAAKNPSYSLNQKMAVQNLSDAIEVIANDKSKDCKNLKSEIIIQFDPTGTDSPEVAQALDLLKEVCN